MPDEAIPKPPDGQIVTEGALQQSQWAQYRNTLAFSGQRDPSANWRSMVLEDGRAITLYRELELKDDDVSTALDELKYSVAERDWTITAGDDSQAALDAKEFIEDQLEDIDMDAVLDSMLDAPAYGFSIAELMFDTSMGQASLLSIDDAPQELFTFGPRFTPQIGRLQFLATPFAMEGPEVPEEKFLIFTYRGRSRSRTGTPLLQRVFWLSWFKRQILALWLKFAEKGPGTAVVRYQDSADQAQKNLAVQLAEQLIDNTAVAVPENFSYEKELLTIARAQDPAVYKELYTLLQYAIARLIKGETLTSFGNEGGKGSHAQGKTHQDTFDKRSVSIAKKTARVFNTQLVRRLHLWNFGPNVAQPFFGFNIAQEDDLTDKLAVAKGVQSMGYRISERYVTETFKIPVVGPDDVALVPNAAAAAIPIPSTAFSEASNGRVVQEGYNQFDALAAELRAESLALMGTRTTEIVDALAQGR